MTMSARTPAHDACVPSRPVRAHARSHRRWRWRWAARGPPSHTRIIARLTPPGAWRGRDKGNVCLFVFPSPPSLSHAMQGQGMHRAAGRVRTAQVRHQQSSHPRAGRERDRSIAKVGTARCMEMVERSSRPGLTNRSSSGDYAYGRFRCILGNDGEVR